MEKYLDLPFNWESATRGVQFTFVKLGSAAMGVTLSEAGTSGTGTIGILQNKPLQNQTAQVRMWGWSKMIASTAISIKAYLIATTGGKGVTTTTDTVEIAAYAMFEAATATDDIIAVWIPGIGCRYS